MPEPTASVPVLYSRHEHGGHAVRVVPDGDRSQYEVAWHEGPQTYRSARSLLRALYSGGDGSLCARDPGISFDRYFKLGQPELRGGFLDLFVNSDQPTASRALPRRGLASRPGLTVARPSRRLRSRAKLVVEAPWWDKSVVVGGVRPLPSGAWVRSEPTKLTITKAKSKSKRKKRRSRLTITVPEEQVVLGIDLEGRSHEVRKLLFGCFGARMARLGYDPEDVLQEVYRGLLARNIGTCPWDIRKSSFGHYVHMVTECVLRNYTRKQRRISKHEQVGVYAASNDKWGMVDAAIVAVGHSTWGTSGGVEETVAADMAMSALEERLMESGRSEAVLAVLALPHVNAGCQRRMISERVSEEIGETVKPTEIGKALSLLRATTREWAVEQGLR